MRRRHWVGGIAALAAAALVYAVVGAAGAAPRTHHAKKLTHITLQLKWVTQAQFAGYYAAQAKGYYKQMGLDVSIKPGGPGITPEQVVAGGQAQIGIDWLSSLMTSRDKGIKLIDIAQVFNRSGLTLISWKDSGINTIAKMRNKTVGNWLFGNEYEVFAALSKFGMDPEHQKGVKIFQQPFDMNAFMKRQIDVASAMTYNELAQVLESVNPKTGKLTKLSDLNVIPMQKVGTGMLEDDVFTTESWIKSKTNQAIAKKFLAASFKGWVYCRAHVNGCANLVVSKGTALPAGHQKWMMNEINALIWPAPLGIGIMNPRDYARSAQIVKTYGKLKKLPGHEAYRTDLAKAADAMLKRQHIDIYGKHYKKAKVAITPGGK